MSIVPAPLAVSHDVSGMFQFDDVRRPISGDDANAAGIATRVGSFDGLLQIRAERPLFFYSFSTLCNAAGGGADIPAAAHRVELTGLHVVVNVNVGKNCRFS
jgi:hypothetical protein